MGRAGSARLGCFGLSEKRGSLSFRHALRPFDVAQDRLRQGQASPPLARGARAPRGVRPGRDPREASRAVPPWDVPHAPGRRPRPRVRHRGRRDRLASRGLARLRGLPPLPAARRLARARARRSDAHRRRPEEGAPGGAPARARDAAHADRPHRGAAPLRVARQACAPRRRRLAHGLPFARPRVREARRGGEGLGPLRRLRARLEPEERPLAHHHQGCARRVLGEAHLQRELGRLRERPLLGRARLGRALGLLRARARARRAGREAPRGLDEGPRRDPRLAREGGSGEGPRLHGGGLREPAWLLGASLGLHQGRPSRRRRAASLLRGLHGGLGADPRASGCLLLRVVGRGRV